jgi:hypothetical protein
MNTCISNYIQQLLLVDDELQNRIILKLPLSRFYIDLLCCNSSIICSCLAQHLCSKLVSDSALQKLNLVTCYSNEKCSAVNSEQIPGDRFFI